MDSESDIWTGLGLLGSLEFGNFLCFLSSFCIALEFEIGKIDPSSLKLCFIDFQFLEIITLCCTYMPAKNVHVMHCTNT